jgi:hypothetical protein
VDATAADTLAEPSDSVGVGDPEADASDLGTPDASGATADEGEQGGEIDGPDTLIGAFRADLVAPVEQSGSAAVEGFTSLFGRVQDGPSLSVVVWEEVAFEGGCTLLVPRTPFCPEPCGADAACVEDDTCAPYAKAQSVGEVVVKGLSTESAVSLQNVGGTYQVVGQTLPYPAFAEGASVQVIASGSDFAGPFSLTAWGIAPFVLHQSQAPITEGAGVALTWEPPNDQSRSRVLVEIDVSHHGGAKGLVQCDVDDDGAFTVPAAIADGLVALGTAGFPTLLVGRHSQGEAQLEQGRVRLSLVSETEIPVDIEGLQSCVDDSDCPLGALCGVNLACQ